MLGHQVKEGEITPKLANIKQNHLFAWKRVDTRGLQDEYQREVKTMQARRHEHLMPLIACYLTPAGQSFQSLDAALHLVFPWAVTNMFDWMRSRNTPTEPTEHRQELEDPRRRKEYLYDAIMSLVSALSYLHREIDGTFTSHHDLKPQNILLLDKRWTISDFGMTRLRSLDKGSQTERNLGSYPYQPPEYFEKEVKKHGRSFDIWSLGCIIVELAVLIVHGWESKKLDTFQTDRSKNRDRDRPRESVREDVSFHNNTRVVYRWIKALAGEDGSPNFKYLMNTAARMLSIDRDARPYSWDVEICLYEQFNPDVPGQERRQKMKGLVQAPMETSRYNPLVRAIAENNEDWMQCLQKNGWALASSSSTKASITDPKDKIGDTLSLFENFALSSAQIRELFKRTFEARFDSYNTAVEALAQRFEARLSPSNRSFWKIKHILQPRHPLDSMKIFAGEVDVDHAGGDRNTALFWASWGNDVLTVDILLRYGARVDPINHLFETPLMVASKLGHADVIERLLREDDVNINHRDNHQRTSLSYASDHGRVEAVRLLLGSQAGIDMFGEGGRTPLSLAGGSGRKEVFELLLDQSADPLIKDKVGISALTHTMAEYRHRKWKGEPEDNLRGYPDIIDLLKGRDRVNEPAVRDLVRLRNRVDPR